MNRLLYNQAIINRLQKLVKKHPDLRFGQIIFNSGIINSSSEDLDGRAIIDNPFYEESETTWRRMTNNKFAFYEKFN